MPQRSGNKAGRREGPDSRFRFAIRAAHRPPRARAERLLRDRAARSSRPSAFGELAPQGLILSGGPASVYEARRAAVRPGDLSTWAFPCWASATACSWPARRWAAKSKALRPANMAGPMLGSLRTPICSPACRRDRSLDEPRRPGVAGVATISSPLAETATCPIAAVKHRTLPIYGLQFHPEVTHTPLGAKILANFLTDDLRLHRHLAAGRFCRASRSSAFAQRVGDRPRDLRPVGRRRFVGRGGAALSGHRLAALLHPGRQRAAAQGRRRVGHPRVHARTSTPICTSSRPRTSSWPLWPASPIRRKSGGGSAMRSSSASPTRRPRSRAPTSWPRARFIPT